MTPEEKRAYDRAYREAHKEEIKELQRAYYLAHRETILARHKVYNRMNQEARKMYRKEQYKIEACKILKKHKEDLADDPERLSTDFILKLVQGGC